MVFLVFMTPVPIGAALLVRGAVPVYIRRPFNGPILAPMALLSVVPFVVIVMLWIVIAMMLSLVTILVPIAIISILHRSGGYDWH